MKKKPDHRTGQLTFAVRGDTGFVAVTPRGKHYIQPRGYAHIPGTGPEGETCGTCDHCRKMRRWYKCGHNLAKVKWTHGRRSDILFRSPACKYWKATTPPPAKEHRHVRRYVRR